MARRKSQLELKAQVSRVDADDILELAQFGNANSIALLRELKAKYDWANGDSDKIYSIEHLGNWADIVCEFLDGGYERIVELSLDRTWFPYCLGLIESVTLPESTQALDQILRKLPPYSMDTREDFVRVAQVISTTPPRLVQSVELSESFRAFLHHLLEKRLPQHMRASVISALREVGSEESINLIQSLRPIKGPFEGIEARVISYIRSRLRDR
jgi:hypothetical protein